MKTNKKKIPVQKYPGIISKGYTKYRGNFYAQYLIPLHIPPDTLLLELRAIVQPHYKDMYVLHSNRGRIRREHGDTEKKSQRAKRDEEIWNIHCENETKGEDKVSALMLTDVIIGQLRMKHFLPRNEDLSVSQINRVLARFRKIEKAKTN